MRTKTGKAGLLTGAAALAAGLAWTLPAAAHDSHRHGGIVVRVLVDTSPGWRHGWPGWHHGWGAGAAWRDGYVHGYRDGWHAARGHHAGHGLHDSGWISIGHVWRRR